MSYFEDWNKNIEAQGGQGGLSDYAQRYYELETAAYKQILAAYPDAVWKSSAKEMAEKLGFATEMDIYLGFLEGISSSLKNKLDLPSVSADTEIELDIDYEKLFWNMHDASAKWLFELEEWDNIFSTEERVQLTKAFNREHIAVSTKVGRNDPCTCGSGKKYKNCCGKRS